MTPPPAWRTGLVPTTPARQTDRVPTEYSHSEQLRGARIHLCDLAGAEIRDCEVSGLKIVDCYGVDVYLGGDFTRLVVNDVDVTSYVADELDRRHPARVLVREATTPQEYRTAWKAVEALWAGTFERARTLPEGTLKERVDGEFSFLETHRHLLFASDAWLGSCVLDDPDPYHPLGLPAGGMAADDVAKLGLTPDATPSREEVLALRLQRLATMRELLAGITEADLDRTCGRKPAEPYPDQTYVVRRCLTVVLQEEVEHHRYSVRDLDALGRLDAGNRPD